MPYQVVRYEPTPNPNAIKCWLDKPISEGPRSFLNRDMASGDAIAERLFDEAGVSTILMNGEWMTVNKPPDADWKTVKAMVEEVLAAADEDGSSAA